MGIRSWYRYMKPSYDINESDDTDKGMLEIRLSILKAEKEDILNKNYHVLEKIGIFIIY